MISLHCPDFCIVKFKNKPQSKAELHQVRISRPDNCVVKINYPDDAEINLDLARRITLELFRRFGRESLGLVHIAGRNTTVAEGVREYLAEKSVYPMKVAEAFVVKNLNQRILGNFYLRIGRPSCPTEVFTLEDEAVKWVKMYCRKRKNPENPEAGLFGAN